MAERELAKAYAPAEVEGAIYERWLAADVFAPDGAGSTRRHVEAEPFVIIQPPPNVTGSPAPGPRPADHGRGPDDPPRADARTPDAVPARPRPRQHRRPVRARRDPRQGGREPRDARPRALPRADARVRRADTRASSSASSVGSGRQRDWGRLRFTMDEGQRQGRARRLHAAVRRRPRLSHRGARQLVPGLPDQPSAISRSSRRRRRARCGRPLPPGRRGHGRADARMRSITVATTRPETILGDTGGRRPSGRRALRGARRAPGADPVRGPRRPDHRRRRGRSRPSARVPSRSRPPTTTTTTRPAAATACAMPTILDDDADDRPTPARATTGSIGTRREPRSSRTSRRAATSTASRPTRWSSVAASAATTSSSRASRPSGSSGRRRSPSARARGDPRRADHGSCRSGSRRPGSTG